MRRARRPLFWALLACCLALGGVQSARAQDALGPRADFSDDLDAILKAAPPPSAAPTSGKSARGAVASSSSRDVAASAGEATRKGAAERSAQAVEESEARESRRRAREEAQATAAAAESEARASRRLAREEAQAAAAAAESEARASRRLAREEAQAAAAAAESETRENRRRARDEAQAAAAAAASADSETRESRRRAREEAQAAAADAESERQRTRREERAQREAENERQRAERASEKSRSVDDGEQPSAAAFGPNNYESLLAFWHAQWPEDDAQVLATHAGTAPALSLHPVGKWQTPYVLIPDGPDGGFDDAQVEVASKAFGSWQGGPRVSPRLLDLIYHAAKHFDVYHVHLVSGVRHDRSGSRHSHALAADIVLAGVDDEELAAYFRPQGFCGVGIYTKAGFVHIDVRERSYFWLDKSPPGRRTRIIPVRGDEAKAADEAAVARGQQGYVNPPRLQKALHARFKRRMAQSKITQ
jgi:hypothetical protein